MTMPGLREKYMVGELRPSQLLHTFGVGAIVDLPNLSVMVLGLDDWAPERATLIGEERLLLAVQQELGRQVEKLLIPPARSEARATNSFDASALVGVPVATFPLWLLCPACRVLAPLDSGLFQLKPDRVRLDRTRYVHTNCSQRGNPPPVIPAQFLVACQRGHLDDFPWNFFVHEGTSTCSGVLRLRERGISGEPSDIYIICEQCREQRPMALAFGEEAKRHLPACRGRRPHLRDFDDAECSEQLKTILLGASNSWFGVTLSALSVPTMQSRLEQLVTMHWHLLQQAESQQNIQLFRSIQVLRDFADYSDQEIWDVVERRRSGEGEAARPQTLKGPEWQVLTNPASAPRTKHFEVSAVPPPEGYASLISQVMLVERLREVSALIGFTRIASPGDFSETAEIPEEYRAPLARRAPTWVPATEVHGEGIFIRFREDAVNAWLSRPELGKYSHLFYQGHREWRRQRGLDEEVGYPGPRYILLHSFAHALMRQLALECGYTLASIRERIYALEPTDEDGPMAGVLLYTAAPDSEGTLGGLVHLGTPTELGRHIAGALEQMRLCASDPLCAEHTPRMAPKGLHAAACHACLFAPETSCERGNKYLDRTLLIPTVARDTLAFFED